MSGMGRRRPLHELWRNGDWRTNAWFLGELDGIEARRGRGRYTHARLRELADVLLDIFPTEVCRRQLARPSGGGHLGGLFFHIWGHLVPLLELAELVACAVAIPDRLRTRLAIPEEVLGAQLELELLAAARLARLVVDHEPLGDEGPDLRVLYDYREYFIEAKQLEQSDASARAETIERELAYLLLEECRDRPVSIYLDAGGGSPLPLDRRGRLLIDEVEDCARAACADFIASAFHPRHVPIAGIGTLYIGPPVDNWASVKLFAQQNDEHDSERAVRLVRDAASQLPPRGRRMILVEMAREADVDDAARLYKARAAMRGPYYVNVDVVVFRRGDTGKGRIVATPGEEITRADRELISVLSQPMPPERPRSGGLLLL